MDLHSLADQAKLHLQRLCIDIPNRRTGSAGNRQATDYAAGVLRAAGWQVVQPEFTCIDWREQGADLVVDGVRYEASASPYTLGCDVQAELVEASTVAALEGLDITGRIVLLWGEIARGQFMPKRFPFYYDEEQQHVMAVLEQGAPLAIVAATDRDAGVAGGVYPFALFEDGDFDIPSVCMTAEEGARLRQKVGRTISVRIRAERTRSSGCNVIARKGTQSDRKVIFSAHIDAKDNTPGAIDNAGGVAVLFLLAGLLKEYDGKRGIDLFVVNGEDYYAASGEILYLEQNKERMGDIVLNVNIDGAGYPQGATAFSLYECPEALAETVRRVLGGWPGLVEGDAWYQGDHSVFLQNGVSAVAVTSELMMSFWGEIPHTPRDRPEGVDAQRLANLALALAALVKDI